MSVELWEAVKITALKPGDEVRFPNGERYFWTEGDVQAIVNCSDHYPDKVRKYAGPSPDVLRRALHIAIVALYDDKLYVPTAADPQNYIRQAIRELESEAGR